MRKFQERDIERWDNCFGGAPGKVDSFVGILGLVSFGRSFRQSSLCGFFGVQH
jgi:hypothetical protein